MTDVKKSNRMGNLLLALALTVLIPVGALADSWMNRYGNLKGSQRFGEIAATPDGGAILGGVLYDDLGDAYAGVVKLSSHGNVEWSKGYGMGVTVGVEMTSGGNAVVLTSYVESGEYKGLLAVLNPATGQILSQRTINVGWLSALYVSGNYAYVAGTTVETPNAYFSLCKINLTDMTVALASKYENIDSRVFALKGDNSGNLYLLTSNSGYGLAKINSSLVVEKQAGPIGTLRSWIYDIEVVEPATGSGQQTAVFVAGEVESSNGWSTGPYLAKLTTDLKEIYKKQYDADWNGGYSSTWCSDISLAGYVAGLPEMYLGCNGAKDLPNSPVAAVVFKFNEYKHGTQVKFQTLFKKQYYTGPFPRGELLATAGVDGGYFIINSRQDFGGERSADVYKTAPDGNITATVGEFGTQQVNNMFVMDVAVTDSAASSIIGVKQAENITTSAFYPLLIDSGVVPADMSVPFQRLVNNP